MKFTTKVLIVCVSVCFIAFLVFVSILGENNSVQGDVRDYIQDVLSKDNSAAMQFYSDNSIERQKTIDEAREFHFALELAMLEYFGLMEEDNYSIKIQRENMWIPFSISRELKVSVKLAYQRESETIIPTILSETQHRSLKEFITLVREDGKWKISSINIEGSELEGIYKGIQSSNIVGKYLSITQEGFVFKERKFPIEKLSPLERRVLAYDLQSALEVLHKKKQRNAALAAD